MDPIHYVFFHNFDIQYIDNLGINQKYTRHLGFVLRLITFQNKWMASSSLIIPSGNQTWQKKITHIYIYKYILYIYILYIIYMLYIIYIYINYILYKLYYIYIYIIIFPLKPSFMSDFPPCHI